VDTKAASAEIKKQALELGFFACGIAEAAFLKDHEPRLKKWLDEGRHGEMAYMANHFNKRLDPAELVENARSVIVVLQNYFPENPLPTDSDYLISRYAYGTDYHFVIKEKLRKLEEFIQNRIASHQCRVFTDSAPVLERAWAVKAGLGWIGKNSMLITPRNGSYFFIGEIITDLELAYDDASGGDYCGDCTRCIDACPTTAIGNDRMIDSGKCISYLTIEKRGELPEEFRGAYNQWIFGCDICQEVCPWNRYSIPHNENAFRLVDTVRDWKATDWENLDQETFNKVFGKSPLKRAKFEEIKRNIQYLKNTE
jgi:epoxyqueuosine reductase